MTVHGLPFYQHLLLIVVLFDEYLHDKVVNTYTAIYVRMLPLFIRALGLDR